MQITPNQARRLERLKNNPICSHCGQTKTIEDFPAKGVDYWCNACRREYAIQSYHKRRESLSREDLKALRNEVNTRQTERRRQRMASMSPEELAAFKARVNAENLKRRDAVRDQAYQAYGGYKCNCCGITERAFLSLDHINNDGAKHKRECKLRTGEQLYRWIVKNNFPPMFQVLCMNCQWGKRNNKGICPHQSEKV